MNEKQVLGPDWEFVGNGSCTHVVGCHLAQSICKGDLYDPALASLVTKRPLDVLMPCGGRAIVQTTSFSHVGETVKRKSELVVTNYRSAA